MRQNRLGQSDLFVSEIGLGCMSLGTEPARAIRMIHAALERGVNFLDTADLYGQGLNEELVGKAIAGRRQQVILATKVGNHWHPGQPGWLWDPSKAYILQAVKDSLRRLGTDYIDLYQLHGGTIDDPIDETIEAFEQLRQEGVIRYYGISSIRPNVIREYVQRSNIVSVMMQYSLLDRRPEESVLSLLHQHNISVIARGPLAGGLLTQNGVRNIPGDGYVDWPAPELADALQRLTDYANTSGLSLTTLALRYPLAHPAVATVIPGASRMEQLIENLDARTAPPLTREQVNALRRITRANVYAQHR
ncbi:aldo/keto reductase [Alicyclobacillus kakegawensis]|uniref:aldo/keto reductase n=1 Tax=Alicyclobacillus kakegawensis TaxID=392012 RepID=UPI00082DC613|nr:aldo/keto reductase [Alicyclobacillus kakegawensis]